MVRNVIAGLLLALPMAVSASSEGGHLEQANTNIKNQASLQRGAQLFSNYCLSCHSASYVRYRRLAVDLGLTESQVLENLAPTTEKIDDMMVVAMSPEDAEDWFGVAPPDLSLVARSRGVDWLYTFLKSFYLDETRDTGWNNALFENTSMPNPLWQLQGIQVAVFEERTGQASLVGGKLVYAQTRHLLNDLELVKPGIMTEEEFDQAISDLVTFLEYIAEPSRIKRESVGIWVLLFLAAFTILSYLMYKEYWKDVN
jgi:ubiquinol-cytochrome c reductase cytochrome c1 subunit